MPRLQTLPGVEQVAIIGKLSVSMFYTLRDVKLAH